MIKYINYKDNHIKVQINGQGNSIVLLHGYLESVEIWEPLVFALEKEFQVICIDLPGHGKSGVYFESHEMDFMADAVKSVLDHLQISKCFLVGHSMGGYVALAFLEMYPHYLAGFSLFHSTPFADDDEKKQNRNRIIDLVKAGKRNLIFKEHVESTFSNDNLENCKTEIDKGISIAQEVPDEGIIAALNGMKSRPDRTRILQKTSSPFLLILGRKDNFIDSEIYKSMKLPAKTTIKILENSGHMGMLEEKQKSIDILIEFANNIYSKKG